VNPNERAPDSRRRRRRKRQEARLRADSRLQHNTGLAPAISRVPSLLDGESAEQAIHRDRPSSLSLTVMQVFQKVRRSLPREAHGQSFADSPRARGRGPCP